MQTETLEDLGYVNDKLARLQSKRQKARCSSIKISLPMRKYYDELLQSQSLMLASFAFNRGDSLMLDQILEHSRKDQEPEAATNSLLLRLFCVFRYSTDLTDAPI